MKLRNEETIAKAHFLGIMDRIVKDNSFIKTKHYKYIAGVLFILATLLFFTLRDKSSIYKIDLAKIEIAEVFNDVFNDYILLTGIIEPISTVYIDVSQGGHVESILIEEGSMVKQGDVIMILINPKLDLDILDSEADQADRENTLRETMINIEQQKLTLKSEMLKQKYKLIQLNREYEGAEYMFKNGMEPEEAFRIAGENLQLALELNDLLLQKNKNDSIFRVTQLEKIQLTLDKMARNIKVVYRQKEALNVKAPIDGQLVSLDANLGELISTGQRIGQVNVLTSYKIKAHIDQYYIDRVSKGQAAYFIKQADTFKLKISKIYPDVREGQFDVDFKFRSSQPHNIRTGQSYNINLLLGESHEAVQIPRGGFFQSTGGQWVYVLSDDESFASKRNIKIGKQNPKHYEVIEGLAKGEKVIISNYDTYGENDKIVFNPDNPGDN